MSSAFFSLLGRPAAEPVIPSLGPASARHSKQSGKSFSSPFRSRERAGLRMLRNWKSRFSGLYQTELHGFLKRLSAKVLAFTGVHHVRVRRVHHPGRNL